MNRGNVLLAAGAIWPGKALEVTLPAGEITVTTPSEAGTTGFFESTFALAPGERRTVELPSQP